MTFIVMVDGIDVVDGRIGGRVVSGLLFLSYQLSTVNKHGQLSMALSASVVNCQWALSASVFNCASSTRKG